jgi:hypothetical protein
MFFLSGRTTKPDRGAATCVAGGVSSCGGDASETEAVPEPLRGGVVTAASVDDGWLLAGIVAAASVCDGWLLAGAVPATSEALEL